MQGITQHFTLEHKAATDSVILLWVFVSGGQLVHEIWGKSVPDVGLVVVIPFSWQWPITKTTAGPNPQLLQRRSVIDFNEGLQ